MRDEGECPHCGSTNLDAEYVDIGVGYQRVTPLQCRDCEACEFYDLASAHVNRADNTEFSCGWWKGPEGKTQIPLTTDVIERAIEQRHRAEMAYVQQRHEETERKAQFERTAAANRAREEAERQRQAVEQSYVDKALF